MTENVNAFVIAGVQMDTHLQMTVNVYLTISNATETVDQDIIWIQIIVFVSHAVNNPDITLMKTTIANTFLIPTIVTIPMMEKSVIGAIMHTVDQLQPNLLTQQTNAVSIILDTLNTNMIALLSATANTNAKILMMGNFATGDAKILDQQINLEQNWNLN